MNKNALLKKAVDVLKSDYPGLTPEAVVCFLFIMAQDGLTVGDVARTIGLTEPIAYRHLSELQKVGFIQLENRGDGSNLIHLTEDGRALSGAVNSMLVGG